MDSIEKTNVPAHSRRQLTLGVFLRKGYPPVVVVYTGSSYEGMKKLKQYERAPGEPYQTLSAPEYCDALDLVLPKLRKRHEVGKVLLLHDRATPHRAKSTIDFLQKKLPSLSQLVLLPTDSPDLTPCDSHFLAEVKHLWNELREREGLAWGDACKKILQLIPTLNPDPYIEAMQLRWEACVAANGWHIEQELEVLKLKRRHL
jgi:hypothetical protein